MSALNIQTFAALWNVWWVSLALAGFWCSRPAVQEPAGMLVFRILFASTHTSLICGLRCKKYDQASADGLEPRSDAGRGFRLFVDA